MSQILCTNLNSPLLLATRSAPQYLAEVSKTTMWTVLVVLPLLVLTRHSQSPVKSGWMFEMVNALMGNNKVKSGKKSWTECIIYPRVKLNCYIAKMCLNLILTITDLIMNHSHTWQWESSPAPCVFQWRCLGRRRVWPCGRLGTTAPACPRPRRRPDTGMASCPPERRPVAGTESAGRRAARVEHLRRADIRFQEDGQVFICHRQINCYMAHIPDK